MNRTAQSTTYASGACNIGPAETARRRRVGHASLAITAISVAALIAVDAGWLWYLVVALPAGAAASGYLQARARFCAHYGFLGVYAMGRSGETHQVDDPQQHDQDRRRARQILLRSASIGVVCGVLAAAVATIAGTN